MKTLLLVDPIYNPGNIPPSVSLGKIESVFLNTEVDISLSDFVIPEASFSSYSDFLMAEHHFVNETIFQGAKSDVVYISAEHGNELKPYPIFPRIKRIAEGIKRSNPKTTIITGGALITLLVDVYGLDANIIKSGVIDTLVTGQALRALMPIAKALSVAIPQMESVYTKWVSWDFAKYPPYVSVQLRSGCAYKCDFCFEGKIYDKKNLNESIESVCATIHKVASDHGITRFLLEDSVVMSYPDFSKIVEAFTDTGGTFAAYARVSEIHRWPKKVELLKEAGATCLIVGIETLDDSILKSINKQSIGAQSREALTIAKSLQINVQGCFMLGFAKGGLRDAEQTIDFAFEQDLNCYRWHIYMPHYQKLDGAFFSPKQISVYDLLEVQVDIPDRFLLQALGSEHTIGFLDQHVLVRALPHTAPVESLLEKIGYEGSYNYRQLVAQMRTKILHQKFPLNEDAMYPLLFNRGKTCECQTEAAVLPRRKE